MNHVCGLCPVQSYEGQVELVPPEFLKRPDGRGICVDACLSLEVTRLWRQGIKTTGCCCGHGDDDLAFISVIPEHAPQMTALGYAAHPHGDGHFVPLAL